MKYLIRVIAVGLVAAVMGIYGSSSSVMQNKTTPVTNSR
jgi:hypothetical protein